MRCTWCGGDNVRWRFLTSEGRWVNERPEGSTTVRIDCLSAMCGRTHDKVIGSPPDDDALARRRRFDAPADRPDNSRRRPASVHGGFIAAPAA